MSDWGCPLDTEELARALAAASLSFPASREIWQGAGVGRPPRGLLFDRFLNSKRRDHERRTLHEFLLIGLGTILSAVAASLPDAEAKVVATVTLERTFVGHKPSDENWKLLRFSDLHSAKLLSRNRLASYVQHGADPKRICALLIHANTKYPRLLVAGLTLQTFGTPVLSSLSDHARDLCRQLTPGDKPRLYDQDFVRLALNAMSYDK